MILDTLTEFSNRYGANSELVLAGGGNTSAKDDNTLYIKGSGTQLATIQPDGFVKMDRAKLDAMLLKEYPSNDAQREAAALEDLMAARQPGEENKRPSVETLLHNLFVQRYVLHLHPALVNGLTCAVNGENEAKRLFPDAVWVGLCRPGYILSKLCDGLMKKYRSERGKDASLMLLQNHGIFIAADTAEELGENLGYVLGRLTSQLKRSPVFGESAEPSQQCEKYTEKLSTFGAVVYDGSSLARSFAADNESAQVLLQPFTPDHIVYCKAHPVYVETPEHLDEVFSQYRQLHGYLPRIVIAKSLGFFAVADTQKQAQTARLLFNDAIKIAVYAESFGGALHMTQELTDFIVNWEVEAYRSKQS